MNDRAATDPRPDDGRRIGILTTDISLVVTSWDAALAAMTGIAPEAAVGQSLPSLVPDLESRGLLDVLREPLDTGVCRVLAPALHGFLIRCAPPPGSRFDQMRQRVVIGPLRDADRTVGLAITIEDVTERLEREQALASELRTADPAARMRAIEALELHEPVDGVGPLRDAIADDDWQVRRTAVRALASRRDPSIVEALVTALREHHRNFSVLSSALQLLTTTGIDLTAALVELLQHEDADLRIQAALALGSQEQPAGIAALIGALGDGDVNVRFHAIEALGKLAPPAAVERLAAIAESNDFFLAFPALDALARISDPAVGPRVVPLLQDALVGDQAAEVLGQIGDEDAVEPLVATLDRAETSVTGVVDALVAIARRYRDTLGVQGYIEDMVRRTVSPAAAQRIIDAAGTTADASLKNIVVLLGWLRGPAVERALTHLLGASSGVHQELIEAIVRFGAPMVDRLIDQLRNGDPPTRRAAAIALGHIGDARAVPALVELLEEGERDLLVPVAGALARLGDPRAFDALVSLLGDDGLAVRHAAIGALNSIGHPGMAARMRALLDSPDVHLRESAVKIAGYFGYRECAEGLLERCHDPDEAVRAAALEHVAYLDDHRVLPLLVQALERDTPRARAAAVQALAHVASPDVLPILRRAASDADPWVRYFSVTSLGRQVDRGALTVLDHAAHHDQHQPVRIAAVEAIGAIGGDEAADLLATLTRGPAEVSVGAMAALGQTGSARALEPLRGALSDGDPIQRAAAAGAIARWGHDPAVDLLQWTAAADADASVVRAAIGGLSRIGGGTSPAAGAAIAALAAVASDPARRAEAVAALARVPVAAISRVGACLSSRDPHVRHAVVEALGRLSHPVASAYLRSALEDTDAAVRQHAVVVLARLGSRGVARTFADMARHDPSETVRRAADAALRRSRTADAVSADAGENQ